MRIQRCVSILVISGLLAGTVVQADTVSGIEGTTYSIANGFTAGSHPMGSHLHSSNLDELPPGNPFIPLAGVAEVGGFFGDEEVRGVSEIPLQVSATQAILEFEVLDLFEMGISPEVNGVDGLFGQGPYVGDIEVYLYAGDSIESLSDFEIAPLDDMPLLTIEVAEDFQAGVTIQTDVTEVYNGLVEDLANNPGGPNALGVRLQMPAPADFDAGAITFGNFQLALVPEPNGALALLIGLWACATRRRRMS